MQEKNAQENQKIKELERELQNSSNYTDSAMRDDSPDTYTYTNTSTNLNKSMLGYSKPEIKSLKYSKQAGLQKGIRDTRSVSPYPAPPLHPKPSDMKNSIIQKHRSTHVEKDEGSAVGLNGYNYSMKDMTREREDEMSADIGDVSVSNLSVYSKPNIKPTVKSPALSQSNIQTKPKAILQTQTQSQSQSNRLSHRNQIHYPSPLSYHQNNQLPQVNRSGNKRPQKEDLDYGPSSESCNPYYLSSKSVSTDNLFPPTHHSNHNQIRLQNGTCLHFFYFLEGLKKSIPLLSQNKHLLNLKSCDLTPSFKSHFNFLYQRETYLKKIDRIIKLQGLKFWG
jgi:hypothetical protein